MPESEATATLEPETPTTPTVAAPAEPAEAEPTPTSEPSKIEELGEKGKAALDKEREARKTAEKDAKELRKRLDALDAEKLTETEKLQKKADENEARAATASTKLRKANLLTALADQDLTGGKARAATELLLSNVDFDDDDEPTNLADAIKAAKAKYGDEMFTAATAATETALPDLHAGARPIDTKTKPESTGWFPKLKN